MVAAEIESRSKFTLIAQYYCAQYGLVTYARNILRIPASVAASVREVRAVCRTAMELQVAPLRCRLDPGDGATQARESRSREWMQSR